MPERMPLTAMTAKVLRRRSRPDLHLHGSDYYFTTQEGKARIEAENPNIPTKDWRNALLAMVNEANHYLMAKAPDDTRLVEAIRRASLLLDRDARTVPPTRREQ